MTYPKRPRGPEGDGEMTGLRPAGTLLVSRMKQRLIAQKMKRSIGAIQPRILLFKKSRQRLTIRPPPTADS